MKGEERVRTHARGHDTDTASQQALSETCRAAGTAYAVLRYPAIGELKA